MTKQTEGRSSTDRHPEWPARHVRSCPSTPVRQRLNLLPTPTGAPAFYFIARVDTRSKCMPSGARLESRPPRTAHGDPGSTFRSVVSQHESAAAYSLPLRIQECRAVR